MIEKLNNRTEKRVLGTLANNPDGLSGALLWLSLPWWALISIDLYPTLMRLEREGKIYSAWLPGPYPRKRLYYLALAAGTSR